MENYESKNLNNNQLKNINEENNEIIIELEIDISEIKKLMMKKFIYYVIKIV